MFKEIELRGWDRKKKNENDILMGVYYLQNKPYIIKLLRCTKMHFWWRKWQIQSFIPFLEKNSNLR